MYFDGSSNGSFRAPYYQSADYQTRYPAYLRPVAAPPPVTVNSHDALYPRWYGVRKMATTGYPSDATKPVGFSDSVGLKTTATTAVSSKKRRSTRKQRRRSRKVTVVDGLDLERPHYPSSLPINESDSLRDITPTPLYLASHSPSAENHSLRDNITPTPDFFDIHSPDDNHSLQDIAPKLSSQSPPAEGYNAQSYHTLMTHISNPPSLSESRSSSRPSRLFSIPQNLQTIHSDLFPQRRRAGQEDYPLRYLKNSSIISPPPPPPPTPPPPPPPPPPPQQPSLPPPPSDEEDFPPRGFTPTNIYFQTSLSLPPADEEDNACTNIHLPPPHASGDSSFHPVELLKRTAKRFKLECERRHRKKVIQNEKAQARNIAEQAKHIVIAAKRGWSYDGDHPKGVSWTDDDEPSAIVRLPEYVELERLGLGKYDSDGCWLPSSNRLKKRFFSKR